MNPLITASIIADRPVTKVPGTPNVYYVQRVVSGGAYGERGDFVRGACGNKTWVAGFGYEKDITKAARFNSVLECAQALVIRNISNPELPHTFEIVKVEETITTSEDTISLDLTPVPGCEYALRWSSSMPGDDAKLVATKRGDRLVCCSEQDSEAVKLRFSTPVNAINYVAERAAKRHIPGSFFEIVRIIPGTPKVERKLTAIA